MAGEDDAAQFLERAGYRIVVRNWRSGRFGELDIVARSPDGLLVFVEVKTRRIGAGSGVSRSDSGMNYQGFDAIDWRKQRKLSILARSFLAYHRLRDCSYRFDAILVKYERSFINIEDAPKPEIIHVEGAFGL